MPNYCTYPQALELYQKIDENKQDTLIAGENIQIDGRTISATASGGGLSVSVEGDTMVFSQTQED